MKKMILFSILLGSFLVNAKTFTLDCSSIHPRLGHEISLVADIQNVNTRMNIKEFKHNGKETYMRADYSQMPIYNNGTISISVLFEPEAQFFAKVSKCDDSFHATGTGYISAVWPNGADFICTCSLK